MKYIIAPRKYTILTIIPLQ